MLLFTYTILLYSGKQAVVFLLTQQIEVNSSPCHDTAFKNVNSADEVKNTDKMSIFLCRLYFSWRVGE